MAAGCAQGMELENTGQLFSMSINTRGVARALVVSLKAHHAAGAFGVCQPGTEGLMGSSYPLLVSPSPVAVLTTSWDTQFTSKS